ncbi:hypothetical protein [Bradyrhizobium sp. STM 3809]|uniref:hypothetical protein n=1 Tax=Bradyrhizobium sp. STM 3809 TaxID=551936 RepID=UPI001111C5CD|nr:hypothetical protein [Bradyrhizobium sp. STM 3809]
MTSNIVFLWLRDARDKSSLRAEVARVEGFELVAFHQPATALTPERFGWELFGGRRSNLRLAAGYEATFSKAKRAAEAAYHQHAAP